MRDFETWLRTVCFQKPTPEAHDLAKEAWNTAGAEVSRLRSAIVAAVNSLERDGDEYGIAAVLRGSIEAPNDPMESVSSQAREVPLDPNIRAELEKRPGESYGQYCQRQDAVFGRLMEQSRALPESEVVGAMISFPVVGGRGADGCAHYLVVSDKPLKLAHIPYDASHRVHVAQMRDLTLEDVKRMVDSARAKAAPSNRRRP